MTTKYDNIPVSREKQTYLKVQMIAEAKGFGKRGAGALIEHWVEKEFAAPVCDHPKTSVQVQRSQSNTVLDGIVDGQELLVYQGFYCATCNRVYQTHSSLVAAETPKGNVQDPYGQPIQRTRKSRIQHRGRDN